MLPVRMDIFYSSAVLLCIWVVVVYIKSATVRTGCYNCPELILYCIL